MDLLAQMQTFVRVVDAGSLSAAARSLGLSLPAVSRQLRALEVDLRTTLLVRSTRRLRITESGREWYQQSARILQAVSAAQDAVRGGDGVRGRLVVSAGVTLGTHFVVPRLPAIASAHPELAIDLRLEERLVDLVSDAVDVAIRGGAPPPEGSGHIARRIASFRRIVVASPAYLSGHIARRIASFRRIVVASPAYLRRRGTPREPEQLTRHECLVMLGGLGDVSRWVLEKRTEGDARPETREVEVRGQLRSTTPQALREMAVGGVGIALLPTWLVAEDLERGRLRQVLRAWQSPTVSAWAVYRAELRSAPRITAFLNALR